MKDIIQNKDWEKQFEEIYKRCEQERVPEDNRYTPKHIKDFIRTLISQTKQEVYKEAYKLGVNNALNMISACYSPQSENYNKEVIDDITKTRKFLFSTPQKNIQECKQNPQSVVIDKKICKCFEKDSKHWC